jgi:hypothetical protein
MKKTKADYYEWLMKEHEETQRKMSLVPKRNLEEQAKEALIREYTPSNQKKIDRFKQVLKEIENETRRILPR